MQFDAVHFFVSLVVSSIGFVAFSYGKRQRRLPQMLVGATLVVFPYFVSSVALMLVIATTLLALLWGATRAGY
jgi:hypothetical protein